MIKITRGAIAPGYIFRFGSQKNKKTRIITWVICALISLSGVYGIIRERLKEKQEAKTQSYYHHLKERQELFSRGMPAKYINGLGEPPLFKHFLEQARKLEKDEEYDKAIAELKNAFLSPKPQRKIK